MYVASTCIAVQRSCSSPCISDMGRTTATKMLRTSIIAICCSTSELRASVCLHWQHLPQIVTIAQHQADQAFAASDERLLSSIASIDLPLPKVNERSRLRSGHSHRQYSSPQQRTHRPHQPPNLPHHLLIARQSAASPSRLSFPGPCPGLSASAATLNPSPRLKLPFFHSPWAPRVIHQNIENQ